ncbi:polyprenyl diphosphate synthase [Thermococcus barophilus]|uniref:Tritrans,polycis-undecaprenyl-diphosphate synthase (geranylgeranyl-diphosphate specific) n=2 Tax=Thermococcus barophilus TaxID=55802 RepID=A0A0S1XAJ4_THEBA|nr:polyprenyl diphosphate synthase [Thermococcus barophilus]ADT83662.1 undecaprenyl pyrophosphate synthetase [Thermococcus barophilus MP]ALM74763.1 Tritrans,polycis-undecaprenyl-diphosphate synthase (GGDP specific) [Thermococcus barophilus]
MLIYRVISHIPHILFKPVYDLYERYLLEKVKANGRIPKHVAIIMDGNRRWARKLEKPPWYGHLFGSKKLEEILEWCRELNIKTLTVYAFSTENFKRSPEEVNALMNLFEQKFKELVHDERVHKYGIRVNVIGRRELLPENVRKAAEEAERATRKYSNYILNIALAYGGRSEIVDAIKRIVADIEDGNITKKDIDEELLKKYLYIPNMPDPDIVIRTGGEIRISNFLLYQIAYSELFFVDVYFPEFRKIDFLRIIREYQKRERRFGK